MASVTTWRRLEPRTRNTSLTSLAARVADPLWMIARQWQTGELNGSDNASPTLVHLTAEHSPITRWAPGTSDPAGIGHALRLGEPVEGSVDAVATVPGLTDRAHAGRRFIELLGEELAQRYAHAFRKHFPLPAPTPEEEDASNDHSVRSARLLAGRTIDGAALRQLSPPHNHPFPAAMWIPESDRAAILAVVDRFVEWWDERYGAPEGAWAANRLAAPFRLAAATSTGPVSLTAPEHRGGRVDWHTLDVTGGTSMAAGDPPSAPVNTTTLPARIAFPGMPRPRWWEFEDAAVDVGRIDAAPDDLGRLLLAEFTLVYGNDFYVVPVAMQPGSLCRVLGLTLETCFDETIDIPSTVAHDDGAGAQRAWRMFTSDAGSGSGAGSKVGPAFVLAPSAVDPLEGTPVEEVLFAHDEMANLAWAIELRVTDPTGRVVERREVEHARRQRTDDEPTAGDALRYRLSSSVPESWLPLVSTADGALDLPPGAAPAGRLIGAGFRLDAVELPRVGRRVTRGRRRTRSVDGSAVTWSAWTVRTGRGESSSGLRHDDVVAEEVRP